MKCVIPGPNVKGFGRAIHALSKIGDDLYLEFADGGLILKTINSSRSAYGCIRFRPEFFIYCTDMSSQSSRVTANSDDSRKCKLPIKSLTSVFKSPGHIEKQVDTCCLSLSSDSPKLNVEFRCKYSIVKHHQLHLIETELMAAIFNKDSCTQRIQTEAKVMADVLVNFTSAQEEITVAVAAEHTSFRNYADDTQDAIKVTHTALSLSKQEFDLYDVTCDTEVTFCLKELRAVLFFTEASQLPITFHFSEPGKPLIISAENAPAWEATFVLATIKETNYKRPSSRAMSTPSTNQQTVSSSNAISVARTRSESTLQQNTPSLARPGSSGSTLRPPPCVTTTLNKTADLSQSVTTRHHIPLPPEDVEMAEQQDEDETIPGTPPAKKARVLFQRCFETTLTENPPRPSQILEPDTSDTEDNVVLDPRKLLVI